MMRNIYFILFFYQYYISNVHGGIKGGCEGLNNCSGHGRCSGNKCVCYEGWTASSNSYGANALYAAFDCSARNCPSGFKYLLSS